MRDSLAIKLVAQIQIQIIVAIPLNLGAKTCSHRQLFSLQSVMGVKTNLWAIGPEG